MLGNAEFLKNSGEIPQKTYLVSSHKLNEVVKEMGSKGREFFFLESTHFYFKIFREKRKGRKEAPWILKKKIGAISMEGQYSSCIMLYNKSLQSLAA